MATEMHWWDGSSWRKANEMYVWNGAEWKQTVRMYIYDSSLGSWRLCHTSAGLCFNFNGDYIANLGECSLGGGTVFYSNCANPSSDYSGTNCYIYASSGCTGGVGDTYVQLNEGGTQYNFDTDVNSLIVNVAAVTC